MFNTVNFLSRFKLDYVLEKSINFSQIKKIGIIEHQAMLYIKYLTY